MEPSKSTYLYYNFNFGSQSGTTDTLEVSEITKNKNKSQNPKATEKLTAQKSVTVLKEAISNRKLVQMKDAKKAGTETYITDYEASIKLARRITEDIKNNFVSQKFCCKLAMVILRLCSWTNTAKFFKAYNEACDSFKKAEDSLEVMKHSENRVALQYAAHKVEQIPQDAAPKVGQIPQDTAPKVEQIPQTQDPELKKFIEETTKKFKELEDKLTNKDSEINKLKQDLAAQETLSKKVKKELEDKLAEAESKAKKMHQILEDAKRQISGPEIVKATNALDYAMGMIEKDVNDPTELEKIREEMKKRLKHKKEKMFPEMKTTANTVEQRFLAQGAFNVAAENAGQQPPTKDQVLAQIQNVNNVQPKADDRVEKPAIVAQDGPPGGMNLKEAPSPKNDKVGEQPANPVPPALAINEPGQVVEAPIAAPTTPLANAPTEPGAPPAPMANAPTEPGAPPAPMANAPTEPGAPPAPMANAPTEPGAPVPLTNPPVEQDATSAPDNAIPIAPPAPDVNDGEQVPVAPDAPAAPVVLPGPQTRSSSTLAQELVSAANKRMDQYKSDESSEEITANKKAINKTRASSIEEMINKNKQNSHKTTLAGVIEGIRVQVHPEDENENDQNDDGEWTTN